MNRIGDRIIEPAGEARVAAQADVVVVGGGPAGMSAALAAARNGAQVALLERYNHLGGLASGGMVLVLDDMWDSQHEEISVRGICMTMLERLAKLKLATFPREHEWGELPESYRRWARWGTFDFHSHKTPHPICFAASFDPDGWKRVAIEWVEELGVELRLHSWFARALVEDGRIKGVICETKAGREAILGDIVIDATGDLDVAASAGAPHIHGSYIMTTVFRLGGVDTDAAERFEFDEPEGFAALDKVAKKCIGDSWAHWWLKTPLPGVVWCNCPHMPGLDGLKVEDLTHAEIQGRKHIAKLLDYVRGHMPGFEHCYLVDVAPQTGIRQTRLLEGEYVLNKEDLAQRTRFADAVARGRDYTVPYRTMLPKHVENLLVAGRHYSATPPAQKISREIPPRMALGEAARVAAAMARDSGASVRGVDGRPLQQKLRAQRAGPGHRAHPNPDVPSIVRQDHDLELIE